MQALYSLMFLLIFVLNARAAAPEDSLQRLARINNPLRTDTVQSRLVSTRTKSGVLIENAVLYTHGEDSISCLFIYPVKPAKPRLPAIVYQHWGYGDKSSFREEATALAAKGFVCISVDAPYKCPGNRFEGTVDEFADVCTEGVLNIRRAIDFIASFPQTDTSRIYYVGHSFGATIGGPLLAAEKRIKGAVLMCGAYNWNKMIVSGKYPVWNKIKATRPAGLARMLQSIAPLQSDHFLPAITVPLLLQFGTKDADVLLPDAKAYARAASAAPKTVLYYPAGHGLNKKAQADRRRWLLQKAKVSVF